MFSLTRRPSNPREQPRRTNRCKNALREAGAVSVLFVLLIPVLFGALAVALDFGKLVYERQILNDALDSAVLAGAPELPSNPVAAQNTALQFAQDNDPQAHPAVTFYCVVASSGTAKTVASGQVPGICNPGTTAGARCNETICAIPCPAVGANVCNTISVTDSRDVPFGFAPVIGINTGNTGTMVSAACKGACGSLSPNSMNVVIVADRTRSMSDSNRNLMVGGIKGALQTMNKEQQYVALGTIQRTATNPGSCVTAPSSDNKVGSWIPVHFSNDYTLPPAIPGTTPPLNGSSTLVSGLNCLQSSPGDTGTFLASPMKAAARYLLGKDSNNLGTLPVRTTPARKAIIFETDGQPNEVNISGSTSLNVSGDIASTNGAVACTNLKQVAANAKAQGVLIVTVAFGVAYKDKCATGGENVRDVLAATASANDTGVPSTASNDCSTAALRAIENNDGDFFFCAGDGSELGPIFTSAVNAISANTHLIRLPD